MAGRPSKTRRLDVWMNGQLVGQWSIAANGVQQFAYDASWHDSPAARPLSLSLPLSLGTKAVSGHAVASYFDNLLPDSAVIRARIASRHGAASDEAFDLLERIGRDCVGAVQLLPAGSSPPDVRQITSRPLAAAELEAHLEAVVGGVDLGMPAEDELRISLAGAQEKTAFLYHEGGWHLPQGATPTTHIFKLPMGDVGMVRADFSMSVENEWLCAKIMQAYGLPAADCEIGQFGRCKVLVVERFDRRWMHAGWIARLPQEDFCQVFGRGSGQKYEEKGGPGMNDILDKLRGSVNAEQDRKRFLTTQLLFWMLAAPDGHAKNFSIRLLPGSAFELTPLYDVMSAWPVIGRGPRQFQWQKLKLAMAVRSKNAHYRMSDIQRRHWNTVAKRNAMGSDFESVIEDLLARTPGVVEAVGAQLPQGFPAQVAGPIFEGLLLQAKRLGNAVPAGD
ncbi:type II toxin-antitoxin system HipA family toxin [Noviherbaspirillum suwonense]|uniref:Serine/threonine-protein kinase HipA n=1 Tax=Noviherbaspirillum suwonense TaxID=1224511 RepID=A0ABY1QCC8_9BURK|nr:type II toxin-antitoxin system HipA family toxin [Noviherbaspirillum suwonense]SMP66675.1 serine/threonine-protein kinase HipA [Noviherbaspirillum suwonense]